MSGRMSDERLKQLDAAWSDEVRARALEIWKPYSQSGTVTMGPGLVETDVKSDAVGELTAGQLMDLGWSVDPEKNVWVFTELYKEQPATVAG